jgi:predicted permease
MGAGEVWNLSKSQFLFLRAKGRAFQEMGLYTISRATLSSAVAAAGQAEQVYTAEVSASLPATLGVRLLLGRALSQADSLPGAASSVWLTYEVWDTRFGHDKGVIGRAILVDGRSTLVAGVLAPGAMLPEEVQFPEMRVSLWTPLTLDPAQPPSASHRFRGVGRLKPGSSLVAAQTDLTGLTAQLPAAMPSVYSASFMSSTRFETQALPLMDDLLGANERILWILFAAGGLVLLIACANVANLFLAQAEVKKLVTDIYIALGASRARLALNFLAEALVLSAIGGVLGLVLASAAIRLFAAFAPSDFPRLPEVHLSWASIELTAIASLCAGILFALLPSLRKVASASDFTGHGSMTSSSPLRQQPARRALAVAQIALSVVLSAGAVLLLQSFLHLNAVPLGFDARGVLTYRVVLPNTRYETEKAAAAFYERFAMRTEALGNVSYAGFVTALPLSGYDGCDAGFAEDHPPPEGTKAPCLPMFLVTPGYFRAMGIPVRGPEGWAGSFDGTETAVVVSLAVAKKFWPGEANVIGKSFRVGGGTAPGGTYRVVAVAGDVRANGLDKPPIEALYLPLFLGPPPDVAMVVRAQTGSPEALVPEIRGVLGEIDPQVPMAEIRSMADILAASRARLSYMTLLMAVASAITLLLSGIGVYGLLSFLVSHRELEIAVRLAIGAGVQRVRRSIMSESLRLVIMGLVIGLAATVYLAQFLQALLFGVSSTDPGSLIIVSILLILVATAASWFPAQRATQISPAEVLRRG